MENNPTEYKLTDKWPEPWNGKLLQFIGGIWRPFQENGSLLEFSHDFVKSNPHLFEKVEEEKPCRCTVSHKWLNELEKKARAGEELAEMVEMKMPTVWAKGSQWGSIWDAIKKYREAVKE